MNPETGAIGFFEKLEDAERAGHTVPLTPVQAARFLGATRRERLAWVKKRQKAKDKRKAARKARRVNR